MRALGHEVALDAEEADTTAIESHRDLEFGLGLGLVEPPDADEREVDGALGPGHHVIPLAEDADLCAGVDAVEVVDRRRPAEPDERELAEVAKIVRDPPRDIEGEEAMRDVMYFELLLAVLLDPCTGLGVGVW